MSVSSFLCLSDKAGTVDFDRDTMIVEGVNTIPLCWLALYTADDLNIIHGDEEYQAVLVTSIMQARQRFADRIPVLTQTFPGIKEAFDGWAQMLKMAKQSYIKADISAILDSQVAINLTFADVFDLDDDDEDDENGDTPVDELAIYAEEEAGVRDALSFFEKSSETTWEALLNKTAVNHHLINKNGVMAFSDEWPYVVLGIPVADWLPWKEMVKEE